MKQKWLKKFNKRRSKINKGKTKQTIKKKKKNHISTEVASELRKPVWLGLDLPAFALLFCIT